jgi:potassium/sodium efflux P-type ATPase
MMRVPAEKLAGRLAEPSAKEASQVADALEVSPEEGLGTEEAGARLREVGKNVLQHSSREGVLKLLWRQIDDPLIYVLLAAAALALALGESVDAAVVLAVVIVNTLIGFIQEYQAGKEIEALATLVPDEASVLRDGRRVSITAPEVVPGDILLLGSGDKIPADARLLKSRGLQADEAALSGESVPVDKRVDPVEESAPVAERASMVHGGTLVTSGQATAVVTATGQQTELGRISEMLEEAEGVETPLTRQISWVGKWLTVAIVAVAGLILAAGLLRGYPLVDAVLAAVALAVAAIPEGLPAIITITLAIGVRHMASRRAVIRLLPAAETLGSATVVCSDKTGTLTRGEMTVKELWVPPQSAGSGDGSGEAYSVGGTGYEPRGEISRDGESVTEPDDMLRELLLTGAVCNDSDLAGDETGWRIEGDPTEGALIVAARKLGFDESELRRELPREDSIPFESERQYMATLHRDPQGVPVIYIKGAPEVIIDRCESLAGGANLDRKALLEQVAVMTGKGQRVLALAARRLDGSPGELDESQVDSGFELLGLAGMIDPPRQEAIEAVEACHSAGITVKMITGDHAGTAAAIGRQLGLMREEDEALTGVEIEKLSEPELAQAAAKTNVFARVAPEHKLGLLRSLQGHGEVAAMTGDGVNDAPALKQADIGVAMGITGTDVSRESSDVVLTDDNFSSIAAAVEEGRRVFDNLTKALTFLLPTNLGQALIILFGVMFFPIVEGEPLLPMQPTQVLWVNLVVAVALALPLAFEALEPDTMRRPPRDPKAPILSKALLLRTAVVGLLMSLGGIGLFLVAYQAQLGAGSTTEQALAQAQTAAVTTVILFQIFYLIECRSLRGSVLEVGLWTNKWIYVGIGVLLLLQLGFVYLPFMNTAFGTVPLGLTEWVVGFLIALVVLPVVGLEKLWRRKRAAREAS